MTLESYESLKESLERQVVLSTKKITILDRLKDTDVATEQESLTLAAKQVTTTGIIALMLEAKAEKRKRKEEKYEAFLLENNQTKELFLDYLAGLSKEQIFDFNFIIGGRGTHATPIRILSNGSETIVCSLDAGSQFPDNIPYIERIGQALNVQPYIHIGGTQYAAYGCTIFSIQDLNTMSKMSFTELKEMFDKSRSRPDYKYLSLSPKIVKNIQSLSHAARYRIEHPRAMVNKKESALGLSAQKERMSFVEHIVKHKRSILEYNEEAKILQPKHRNYSLTYKAHKYYSAALTLFNELTPVQVMELIIARSGAVMLDNVHNSFSSEDQQKIVGIYNKQKIELILIYNITKEALLDTVTCFNQTLRNGENILLLIQDVYNKSDEPNKTALARAEFKKISKLSPNQIEEIAAEKFNRHLSVEKFATKIDLERTQHSEKIRSSLKSFPLSGTAPNHIP